MRRLSLLALACLIGGVALVAYGAANGQAQVYLVLIFPVVVGSGPIPLAGTALVMAGFVLGFLSFAGMPLPAGAPPPMRAESKSEAPPPAPAATKRFGGVVFLGPLPIVFGSDARMSRYMLVLGIALTVLLLAFFFLVLSARP
ncbi:MAG TPA: DUF131 domain-containing protein [Thermoplasmata archaeon]|nr:DUF131 domain-containing protein [Thermoplasmata archaeon]